MRYGHLTLSRPKEAQKLSRKRGEQHRKQPLSSAARRDKMSPVPDSIRRRTTCGRAWLVYSYSDTDRLVVRVCASITPCILRANRRRPIQRRRSGSGTSSPRAHFSKRSVRSPMAENQHLFCLRWLTVGCVGGSDEGRRQGHATRRRNHHPIGQKSALRSALIARHLTGPHAPTRPHQS